MPLQRRAIVTSLLFFTGFQLCLQRSPDREIRNWQTGPWGLCWSKDPCGPGVEERAVWCGDSMGRPLPEILCRKEDIPSHSRPCFSACKGIWKVGSWSECHLETESRLKQEDGLCLGTRQRNVSCYSMTNESKPKCLEPIPPSKVSCYTLCPQDCIVGHWTPWTPCKNECDEQKYRTRQVIVAPSHGGNPCPFLSQSKFCTEKCEEEIEKLPLLQEQEAMFEENEKLKRSSNEEMDEYAENYFVYSSKEEGTKVENADKSKLDDEEERSPFTLFSPGNDGSEQTEASRIYPTTPVLNGEESVVKDNLIKDLHLKLRVGEWGKCKLPADFVKKGRLGRSGRTGLKTMYVQGGSMESKVEWEIRDAISILEAEASRSADVESVQALSPEQIDRLNDLRNSFPQVGIQQRNLTCIGNGGQDCPVSDCLAKNDDTKVLSLRSCIIGTDCENTQWSQWKTVVEGCVAPNGQVVKEIRERRRSALQLQKGDGTPCPHLLERHTVAEPALQPCNSKYQWLASTWSPCLSTVGPKPQSTVSCGGGVQEREIFCIRTMTRVPVEEKFCLHVEPPPRYQRCEIGCERDCVVGPWSAWGICTPPKCNFVPLPTTTGYRRRIREVVISPSSEGKECPPIEEQNECPDAKCHQWLIGDWSECTLKEALKPCGKGKVTRTVTCVDALGGLSSNEECVMEIGQVSSEKECQVPCSFDCVIAPWSSWSPCSRPCANKKSVGYTHRNSSIVAPNGPGGKECPAPDELTQVHTCREEPCTGSAWVPGEWGSCIPTEETSCGLGVQIRPLYCIDRSNSNQLQSFMCNGMEEPKHEKSCAIPCGTKCSMTAWSEWSPCLMPEICPKDGSPVASKQRRWRGILVRASNDNPSCENTTEQRSCAFNPGVCKDAAWKLSQWSQCALTPEIECGVGYRVRDINCVNGSGDLIEPSECLMGSHIIPESSEHCFVDCHKPCILSSWTPWTSCPHNKGCNNIKSVRTRQLIDGTDKNPKCKMISLMETQDCLCSSYYSEHGSDWSECLLGPPINQIKKTLNQEKNKEKDIDTFLYLSKTSDKEDLDEYRDERNKIMFTTQDNQADNCGVGTGYRSLKCVRHDKILADPSSCGHSGIEWEPCMVECPSDCLVGAWGEWEECNSTCGAGIQFRSRQVVSMSGRSGRKCPLVNQKRACWGSCNTRWIAEGWNECQHLENNDCGQGTQNRTVSCVKLLSSGMEIVVEDSQCDILLKPLNNNLCTIYCPGQCVVSDWSTWSECPWDCDSSKERERRRKILRKPSENEMECPHLVEKEACNKGVSCWTYVWVTSNWTHCITLGRSSCGEGVRNRPISCIRSDGTSVDERYCSRENRPSPQEKWCYVDCPIDCQVTTWTEWDDSKCSCGEKPGFMKRKRFILVNPSNSGRTCPFNVEEALPCPVLPCFTWERSPWSECQLHGGKCGHGVMERRVSCIGPGGVEVAPEKCLALVHVGGHTWPYLAHALDLNTQDGCYVPCEGDCELTEWSPWSHCHRDCARGQQGGSQTRSRAIISTGASTPCPGPLWENNPCIAGPCLTFTWQIIHGSVACVRSDGLIVTGGCGDVPRPCLPVCLARGSICSPVGVCVCRPGLRPHYSESMKYQLNKCMPNFNMSITNSLPLSRPKYLPGNYK